MPDDAFAAVVRALARTDLTARELDARLGRAGFDEAARRDALERALSAGYLDDERVAHERARRLADRGSSDAAIRADLGRRGLSGDAVAAALATLPSEAERAERVASQFGGGLRAARALARKGFPQEVVERTIRLHIAQEP